MTTTPQETEEPTSVAAPKELPKQKGPKWFSYLPLFLLTVAGGLCVMLFGHQFTYPSDFDIFCMRTTAPSENRLYDLDQKTQVVTSRLLTLQPDRGRKFHLIEITDAVSYTHLTLPTIYSV